MAPGPVRVLRGRKSTIAADRAAGERLLGIAAGTDDELGTPGTPKRAVRVWTPHRQVAFGRRDARLEGYDRARRAAEERGFPPVERSVGGRAVAYDGETALAFARAEPVADFRRGTDDRYERLTSDVVSALERLGLEPVRGEPDASFCPGTHSISIDVDGRLRKVVGIAQRVRQGSALVSGVLLVDSAPELAGVLEAVYDALEVPFDPESVGGVQSGSPKAAEGDSAAAVDTDRVRTVLEDALVGDADRVPVFLES